MKYGFTPCVPTVPQQWVELRQQVGGRLYESVPFAQPCYVDFNSTACAVVRENYLEEAFRSNTPTAYIQSQWETCQANGEHCLLDWRNPNSRPDGQCETGSLPRFYIDVRTADEVRVAFEFSKKTGVPLSVRNTGVSNSPMKHLGSKDEHDYKGRSSAPGSLGLWLHNLQDISYDPEFVPEGCGEVESRPAVTMGAGVRWNEAHVFADKHNITLVGGSDKSVGAVGGWLQGGGHGALTNTMGMGADRALQFKVVTPDGKLRTANQCSNPDLYWALRGGGGGTFGVVLEATVLASPQVRLHTVILFWGSASPQVSKERTREAWRRFVDSSAELAEEGWGGYVAKDVVALINPKSTPGKGSKIDELVQWAKGLKEEDGNAVVMETVFENWLAFFNVFTSRFVASVGKNLAMSSRLVPKSNFSKEPSRKALVEALMHANEVTSAPGIIILFTTPASTPDGMFTPFPLKGIHAASSEPQHPRETSVNPVWRDSLYHVTNIETWSWDATRDEIKDAYRRVRRSLDRLRRLTGGLNGAAYANEADLYEESFGQTFWGDNYRRLLEIKMKYDPEQLLDCWQCVGFNRLSERYGCYPEMDDSHY